ncbi:MAG: imidazole glycerol phosphate synthase subunit HisH [Candidatus Tectomicrobia bacterium]|uniref:Imidazole glycerol phosphate synthase subunit HisH n=1 Tax=Tectimicrobiota bacterium TaxID=2528274 RepID=A0A932HUQ5_UNCTE|nr:imidazole glycerol phosphate synthase subunit HisH [Candidatus Tectomicrobia bacterium]
MEKKKIAIVNYGLGNLQSVENAVRYLGVEAVQVARKEEFEEADGYILPGVGAFGEAMKRLSRSGMIPSIEKEVLGRRKPFLGICLGMQLIAIESCENGRHKGLGWFPGRVNQLASSDQWRLPHVGWNEVEVRRESPLLRKVKSGSTFYFDHSYALECDPQFVSATCEYSQSVVSVIQKDNMWGTQFHPEKSQKNGLRVLWNFIGQLGGGANGAGGLNGEARRPGFILPQAGP